MTLTLDTVQEPGSLFWCQCWM